GPLVFTACAPPIAGCFLSGPEHRHRALAQLAAEFPTMRWILVGDVGQHDPTIYAEFSRRHPEQVDSVLIRQLTEPEQLLAHGSRRPREHSRHHARTPLTLEAPDGHGLLAELQLTGRISS